MKASKQSGELYTNKLNASYRQLNAAILMFLRNDDVLATHTVASAAYRVLFDLANKKPKGQPQIDPLKMSLFAMAKLISEGQDDAIPPLLRHPLLMQIANLIAGEVQAGLVSTWQEVNLRPNNADNVFLRNRARVANYLKHADRDAEELLGIGNLESMNEHLLQDASTLFITLLPQMSDEMKALMVFSFGHEPKMVSWLDPDIQEKLVGCSREQRKTLCLSLFESVYRKVESRVRN